MGHIIQIGMDEALELQRQTDAEQYDAFVDKFRAKKTTDDCYTPPIVYDAILEWVRKEYNVTGPIVRPFFPGEDYQTHDYPEGCTVIDNPPFSILAQIAQWYMVRGIKFFLFAPGLTALGCTRFGVTSICTCAHIQYANGAVVPTSFQTNLDTHYLVRTCPDLTEAVETANKANLAAQKAPPPPKYSYPAHVLTAAMGNYMSQHGIAYNLPFGCSVFIRTMDAQQPYGKSIYGGGLLLAEKAAAEKAAAEKAAAENVNSIVWELSEREQRMINALGTNETKGA
jgi:hypothetical protein